jgi:hypothetical protein
MALLRIYLVMLSNDFVPCNYLQPTGSGSCNFSRALRIFTTKPLPHNTSYEQPPEL